MEYGLIIKGVEIAVRGGGNLLAFPFTGNSYSFTAGCGFSYLGYSLQYAFMGTTNREATLGYGHRICLLLQLDNLYHSNKEVSSQQSAPNK